MSSISPPIFRCTQVPQVPAQVPAPQLLSGGVCVLNKGREGITSAAPAFWDGRILWEGSVKDECRPILKGSVTDQKNPKKVTFAGELLSLLKRSVADKDIPDGVTFAGEFLSLLKGSVADKENSKKVTFAGEFLPPRKWSVSHEEIPDGVTFAVELLSLLKRSVADNKTPKEGTFAGELLSLLRGSVADEEKPREGIFAGELLSLLKRLVADKDIPDGVTFVDKLLSLLKRSVADEDIPGVTFADSSVTPKRVIKCNLYDSDKDLLRVKWPSVHSCNAEVFEADVKKVASDCRLTNDTVFDQLTLGHRDELVQTMFDDLHYASCQGCPVQQNVVRKVLESIPKSKVFKAIILGSKFDSLRNGTAFPQIEEIAKKTYSPAVQMLYKYSLERDTEASDANKIEQLFVRIEATQNIQEEEDLCLLLLQAKQFKPLAKSCRSVSCDPVLPKNQQLENAQEICPVQREKTRCETLIERLINSINQRLTGVAIPQKIDQDVEHEVWNVCKKLVVILNNDEILPKDKAVNYVGQLILLLDPYRSVQFIGYAYKDFTQMHKDLFDQKNLKIDRT